MIYRKSPPQPPRLLLRVVAAGAGAALVAACSSTGPSGSVFGSVANPDAGDDGSESCANGGCGLVGNTPDGSDVSDADIDHVVVGVAPCADAACGSMVNPDAGTD